MNATMPLMTTMPSPKKRFVTGCFLKSLRVILKPTLSKLRLVMSVTMPVLRYGTRLRITDSASEIDKAHSLRSCRLKGYKKKEIQN